MNNKKKRCFSILVFLNFLMMPYLVHSAEIDLQLIDALHKMNPSEAVELINSGANPNVIGSDGDPAIWTAANHGYIDVVILLLAKGADPNLSWRGDTPLMMAGSEGHVEIVKLLIDAGAKVNSRNSVNWTALMMASYGDYTEVVEILLNNGADHKTRNSSGDTALGIAKKRKKQGSIQLIEKAAAKKVKE